MQSGEEEVGFNCLKGRRDNRGAGGGGRLHEHEEDAIGHGCAQK